MTQSLFTYVHTHWDREWYLPFRTYQHRLVRVVDDILAALESQELPCFTLDGQTVLLEDYVALRPDAQGRLKTLVQQNKLSIGPWYVMPDEFLVSGESLIRNLQRGMAIAEAYGETTMTGYLPDTFGHSADIPMVLRQCELDSAVVWRGISPQCPAFHWCSPSQDSVLTYHLTDGYFQNMFHMGQNDDEKIAFFQAWLAKVPPLMPEGLPSLFPIGADHLGYEPDSMRLLEMLETPLSIVTIDQFMATLAKSAEGTVLDTIQGELRSPDGAYILPGVYSSRMYLKQWNRRLEWALTRQTEQLLVWQAMLEGRFTDERLLDSAWQLLLLNHPHDSICGCSVDAVHRDNETRFEQVDHIATALTGEAHHSLSQEYQGPKDLMIINLGDTAYTGVVCVSQDYPTKGIMPSPMANGQVLSEDVILDEAYLNNTSVLPLSENTALRRKTLVWASNVPAHGMQLMTSSDASPDTVVVTEASLANGHVSMTVTPEGTLTIEDLGTGVTYLDMHQLVRREEQGDSYNAAPAKGSTEEKAVFQGSQVLHQGPLYGALLLTYVFPSISLTLTTQVGLYAGSPRLEFDTSFVNQTPNHKVQVCFSAHQPIAQVMGEGHFSPVERSHDPTYCIEEAMPALPQTELMVNSGPIQRFISWQGQSLITKGLTEYEVADTAMKLTLHRGFDMLSKDDTDVRGSHAGPPLHVPEGQCLNRAFACQYAWVPCTDITTVYDHADWFYGAVYGLDRGEENNAASITKNVPMFGWDNPTVRSSACVPHAQGWLLRLFNPTPQEQTTTLSFAFDPKSVQEVTLKDTVVGAIQNGAVVLPPYRLTTLLIQVK